MTRRLYEDAKLRDKFGASKASQITFSKEDVEKADNLFESLKTLYLGKYNALPPSKRSKPRFKDTERYKVLDTSMAKHIKWLYAFNIATIIF